MSSAAVAALLVAAFSAEPRVLDPAYELMLVASEPDLVTPIGVAFDNRGRLLVVESHTHFRPEGYAGPTGDRIRLVEDTNGDGRADRFRTFYEGTTATMGLRPGPDGWMYVATRMEVFRLKDSNGDGTAETREEIAHLETTGDYPHNGLSGIAFGPNGAMYFGMGENLGEPYTLVGSDGSKYSGGGEGGNVFRADADGSNIARVATGFWNPFGLCFDEHGRLYAVDNDPDASPPCRLLHVVPGGDFGFQFRYGRAGRHPLQAWNGELPGTLPMVAGTGEAPSAVVPHHGALWVTSWGHHRVERHVMRSAGATVVAIPDVVVQGDENFRPIDFAVAANGDLYFTDWVDRSYPLHGKGRLWRLRRKVDVPKPTASIPALSDEENTAESARRSARYDLLDSSDPFVHQAAVWGLAQQEKPPTFERAKSARQQLGVLVAWCWRSDIEPEARDAALRRALNSDDVEFALYALRWIADERLEGFRDDLQRLLNRSDVAPRLMRATVAALDWLNRDRPIVKKDDPLAGLLTIVDDESRPPSLRTAALRMLPSDHPGLTAERLGALARSKHARLAREAVRTLVHVRDKAAGEILAAIASDNRRPANLRADAIVGLAPQAETHRPLLERLAHSGNHVVSAEARRSLAASPTEIADGAAAGGDLTSLQHELDTGGDAEAGWRVFFRENGAACSQCHTLAGRGTAIGPDLTGVGRRMDRRRLIESIVQPNKEVAPQYVPWNLVTIDGQVIVGLPIEVRNAAPGVEHFIGIDGREFTLNVANIETRTAATLSIMPNGLDKLMTRDDLRDLLALLEAE